jgi:hypothetical protein
MKALEMLEDLDLEKSIDCLALVIGAIGGVTFTLAAVVFHTASSVALNLVGTALNKLNKKEEGMYETSYIDKTPIESLMSVVDIVFPPEGVSVKKESQTGNFADEDAHLSLVENPDSLGEDSKSSEEPTEIVEGGEPSEDGAVVSNVKDADSPQ